MKTGTAATALGLHLGALAHVAPSVAAPQAQLRQDLLPLDRHAGAAGPAHRRVVQDGAQGAAARRGADLLPAAAAQGPRALRVPPLPGPHGHPHRGGQSARAPAPPQPRSPAAVGGSARARP